MNQSFVQATHISPTGKESSCWLNTAFIVGFYRIAQERDPADPAIVAVVVNQKDDESYIIEYAEMRRVLSS